VKTLKVAKLDHPAFWLGLETSPKRMTSRTTPLAKCLPKDVPPPWAEFARKAAIGATAAKSCVGQLKIEGWNDGFDNVSCIAAAAMA